MSTAPVSNLTMPTCATCPYFSAVHNGESSTCRFNPPPFSVAISENEQIKELPQQLRAEYPAILAWCVQGCLDWQQNGLGVPEEVTTATKEYRDEQDVLGAFFDENAIQNPSVRVRCGQFYQRYKAWAEAGNERLMTMTAFGQAMKERGIDTEKSGGKWYVGIALRDSESDAWVH